MFKNFSDMLFGPEWSRYLLSKLKSYREERDGGIEGWFEIPALVDTANQYNQATPDERREGEKLLFRRFNSDYLLHLGRELEEKKKDEAALVFYHLAEQAVMEKLDRPGSSILEAAFSRAFLLQKLDRVSSADFAMMLVRALEAEHFFAGKASLLSLGRRLFDIAESLDLEFFRRFREGFSGLTCKPCFRESQELFSGIPSIEPIKLTQCFFRFVKGKKFTENSTPSKQEVFDELMKLIAVELDKPLDYPVILLVLLFVVEQDEHDRDFVFNSLSGVWHFPLMQKSLFALVSMPEPEFRKYGVEELKKSMSILSLLNYKNTEVQFKQLSTEEKLLHPCSLFEILSHAKGLKAAKKGKMFLEAGFFCWMIETEKGLAYLRQISPYVRCRMFVAYVLDGARHQVSLEKYYAEHRDEIHDLFLEEKPELNDFNFAHLLDAEHPFYWRHFYAEEEFVEQLHQYQKPLRPELALLLLEQVLVLNINVNFAVDDSMLNLDGKQFPDVRRFAAFIVREEELEPECRVIPRIKRWLSVMPYIQQFSLRKEKAAVDLRALPENQIITMKTLLLTVAKLPVIRVINLKNVCFEAVVLQQIVGLMKENPLLLIPCILSEYLPTPQIRELNSIYKKILKRNQKISKAIESGNFQQAKGIFWGPEYQEFHEENALPQEKVPPLQALCACGLFGSSNDGAIKLPSAVYKETQNRELLQSVIRVRK